MIIKKYNSAFTLIEVLVTLGILMIIISVVIGIIDPIKQRNRAEDAVLQRTMGAIATALESYYNINGSYPTPAAEDLAELNQYFNSPITVDDNSDPSGNIINFTSTDVETGDSGSIIFYVNLDGDAATADACMEAVSNEESTEYLIWREHGAVQKGVAEADSCTPL